jgi:hypothetical protein
MRALSAKLILVLIVLCTGFGFVSAQTHPHVQLATLQGYVTTFDDFGELLPMTWVRVDATNHDFNMTAYTNAYGFYEMTLPAASYKLTTHSPGYASSSANVTLIPGQVLIVNFYL